MENASKALIIAGAILISILLISLGIIMFNSSKGTTDQAGATGDLLENQVGKANDSIREGLGLGGDSNSEINFILYYGNATSFNITFTAKKDMTWYEFINSSYNNKADVFKTSGQGTTVLYTVDGYDYVVRKKSDQTMQKSNMKILSGETYVLTSM